MKKFIAGLLMGVLITSVPMTLAVSNLFSDVPANQWYTNAVINLNEKGIIQGYPNGTFGPSNEVNRAELAVILDRMLQYIEGGTFKGAGFSFNYPSGYIADENSLWTKEGYAMYLNPPQDCTICQIPFVQVQSENVSVKSLDTYIIEDLDLPGTNLMEMSDQTGIEYSQEILGDNNFVKITVNEAYKVIGYYTKKGDQILSFKVYFPEWDTMELRDILSTLQFN